MNCQGYVRLIAQGKEKEAAEEMRGYTPFGNILGRICHHPCEGVCERVKMDEAVHIRALKRYLADSFPEVIWSLPPGACETGFRVAIVGSGPAGLMAAYELRVRGHEVTVFEERSEPGGLLRYGIPSFHLPVWHVGRSVSILEKMGVMFKTGQALGRNVELEKLEAEYGAIILAMGAGEATVLNIPGGDMQGVLKGLNLLQNVKEGTIPSLGRSVVVIGGGNSAMDAALTCRRVGVAEISIVCLENPSQMPAFALELQEVQEEGIRIENCWGPTRLTRKGDGRIEVEFSRCLSLFDEQGIFSPALEISCGLRLQADSIVMAVGQRFDADGISADLLDPQTKRFAVDTITQQSKTHEKVFVAGDSLTGAKSVVDAMASGREAAISIDRFLRGEGLRWGRRGSDTACIKEYEVDLSRAKGGLRGKLRRTNPADRRLDIEVEKIMSNQEARSEAERCLSCGRAAEINHTCWYCLPCEIECPTKALEVRMPYLVR